MNQTLFLIKFSDPSVIKTKGKVSIFTIFPFVMN